MRNCRVLGLVAERAILQRRCARPDARCWTAIGARGGPGGGKEVNCEHPGPSSEQDERCAANSELADTPPRCFHLSQRRRETHTRQVPRPSPLPEQLRTLLRRVTNAVVVCTAAAPPSLPADAETPAAAAPPAVVGLTMSSFTSLSLAPTPLVTFNIALPSRTEAAIAASRAFAIHVLAGDETGAAVADAFRLGNAEPANVLDGLRAAGCVLAAPARSGGAPELRGPGVLSVLRCRVLDEAPSSGMVRVRDHVVVLGEVLDICTEAGRDANAFALSYTDRHYRKPGAAILPGGRGSLAGGE